MKNTAIKQLSILFLFTLIKLAAFTQSRMRPLEQLVNTQEPGWALVAEWIKGAKNKVEVLSCDSAKAKEALFHTQVTTRSPMGAIVYATGGLLVDEGWIRILGSGHPRLNRSLPEWNKGKTFQEYGEQPSFLLVADDAAGGFFALNGGGLGEDAGKMYYLSPDNLKWEPLNLSYSAFLQFCFSGDLGTFYKELRWKEWRSDVLKLGGDQVYNFFPYLWTKEGADVNKVSRKPVPVEEQYQFALSMQKQLVH